MKHKYKRKKNTFCKKFPEKKIHLVIPAKVEDVAKGSTLIFHRFRSDRHETTDLKMSVKTKQHKVGRNF